MVKNILKIIGLFLLFVFILSIFVYYNVIDYGLSRVISLIGLFIITFLINKKNNSIYIYLTIYSLIIFISFIFKRFNFKLLLLGLIFLIIYLIRSIYKR